MSGKGTERSVLSVVASRLLAALAALAALGLALPAQANWKISEIYSSPDGTVQFIEVSMIGTGFPFDQIGGTLLDVFTPSEHRVFTIPGNLAGDTTGRKFLLGSAGFAALGIVTPDFVMPDGFLATEGGTLRVGFFDSITYPPLPTDGRSLDRNGVPGPNTPTNFAGATGAVPPLGASVGVSRSGSGCGTVTSLSPGIACGATCKAAFAPGALVTLVAVADAGSTFAGWSGDCSGTGDCTVDPTADRYVTASFAGGGGGPPVSRFANLSTRMRVGTGDNVLIGGFVIGGSTPRTVVVRGRGPSLAASGVAGALPDPKIWPFNGQWSIDVNDDHATSLRAVAIAAAGLSPAEGKESVIYRDLAPGAYTVIVAGGGEYAGGGSGQGVGIVEIFDTDAENGRLVNLSSRGLVGTGEDVMIAGFIIQGAEPQTVTIRARGPSLIPYAVPNYLPDPQLQLFQGQAQVAFNDNWMNSPDATAIVTSGLAPPDPRESAIRITLAPGAYTAIVSGVAGTMGVAIVEVFAQ